MITLTAEQQDRLEGVLRQTNRGDWHYELDDRKLVELVKALKPDHHRLTDPLRAYLRDILAARHFREELSTEILDKLDFGFKMLD